MTMISAWLIAEEPDRCELVGFYKPGCVRWDPAEYVAGTLIEGAEELINEAAVEAAEERGLIALLCKL